MARLEDSSEALCVVENGRGYAYDRMVYDETGDRRFRLLMLAILLAVSIVTASLGISSNIANSHASAAEVEQSVAVVSSSTSSTAASVAE